MKIDEREIRARGGELTHFSRIQCACMKLEQCYRAAEMVLAAHVRQRFWREPQNRGNALWGCPARSHLARGRLPRGHLHAIGV
jgi:hypothetical protein